MGDGRLGLAPCGRRSPSASGSARAPRRPRLALPAVPVAAGRGRTCDGDGRQVRAAPPGPSSARSTSARTMRPSGPLPCPASVRRSIPAASAMRRAIGLMRGASAGPSRCLDRRAAGAAASAPASGPRRFLRRRGGLGRGVGTSSPSFADDRDRRAQRGRLAVADQDLAASCRPRRPGSPWSPCRSRSRRSRRPRGTLSPSRFSQRPIVPSSIVSDSRGMVSSSDMANLLFCPALRQAATAPRPRSSTPAAARPARAASHRASAPRPARLARPARRGRRSIPAAAGGQLGADAIGRPALLGDQHAVRLAHRLGDGVHVQRPERAQVDHLDLDPVLASRSATRSARCTV